MKFSFKYSLIILILFSVNSTVKAQPSGYTYGKKITINSSNVSGSSNLINFPVLISVVDNDLRTTGNSGNVTSSNGYDILFTNLNGNVVYTHQIEKYVASTGEYIAWVKIDSLSPTNNTELYMYYGNSGVTVDPSSTATWNSDYIVNLHMNDVPTGVIVNSTAETFNASSFGSMTTSDVVTGKIGFGTDFDGSNDGYQMSDNNTLDLNTNDFTFSAWFKTDDLAGSSYQTIFNKKPSGGGVTGFGQLAINNANDQIYIYHKGSGTGQTFTGSTSTINANTWYLLHAVCDVSADEVEIFINGSLFATISVDAGTTLANGHIQYFGSFNTSSSSFNGILDEMRIALTDFSSDWILTEYNNQNSPGTFYTVGNENPAIGLPVNLTNFNVETTDQHAALLSWATPLETLSSHFSLERSYDGTHFEAIANVSVNGTSHQQKNYNYRDNTIKTSENTVFYRLNQVGLDGTSNYSTIQIAQFFDLENPIHLSAYPNPIANTLNLTIDLVVGQAYEVTVTNLQKSRVYKENFRYTNGAHQIDASPWAPGVYVIELSTEGVSEILKVIKK